MWTQSEVSDAIASCSIIRKGQCGAVEARPPCIRGNLPEIVLDISGGREVVALVVNI